MPHDAAERRRKLIEFDVALWQALELLARDKGKRLQELADEAFRDLLKKHGRPVTLKEALRASARASPANDPHPPRKKSR
jgi:macrodomain Ter protein organizer (MatP/YcbG family)